MTNLTETLQIRGERSRLTALSHNFTQWGIKKLPGMGQTSDSDHPNLPSGAPSSLFQIALDCELSLFFFRFSKGSARAREHWAAKPRDARNDGGTPRRKKESSFVVPLLSPSVTRVVIFGSRPFCSTDQEKRRLLVVYDRLIAGNYYP